ncbi:hypothetical protein GLA29479_4801 [Lysobacter antibioticus]|nr:hypothetical protein GLA29479_4801 [Lysobacter antibioticus]
MPSQARMTSLAGCGQRRNRRTTGTAAGNDRTITPGGLL